MPGALVVGVHRDRAERDRGPLPHRRPAADDGARTASPCRSATRVSASRTSPSAREPVEDERLGGVLGAVGHTERQVVQHPGGPEVVRALPAQDEVTVHGVILSARPECGRASTARSGARGPSALHLDDVLGHGVATVAGDLAQGRQCRDGCQVRGPHDEQAAGAPAPSGPPRAPAGAYRGALEECTRKSGPLSTSRSTTSHGPCVARLPPASTSSTSATCSGARARPPGPRARGPGPARAHADQRRRELHDVGAHAPAGRRAPRGSSSPGRARRRAPAPATGAVRSGPLGEGHLGARVDGVHRERPVDDELEHRPTATQHDLAVRGVAARASVTASGPPVTHVGEGSVSRGRTLRAGVCRSAAR